MCRCCCRRVVVVVVVVRDYVLEPRELLFTPGRISWNIIVIEIDNKILSLAIISKIIAIQLGKLLIIRKN